MVLKIAGAAVSAFFPTQYAVHFVAAIVTILVLRAFSQGRKTNRERDLHARVILVTVCVIAFPHPIRQVLIHPGLSGRFHADRINDYSVFGSTWGTCHRALTTSHRLAQSHYSDYAPALNVFE